MPGYLHSFLSFKSFIPILSILIVTTFINPYMFTLNAKDICSYTNINSKNFTLDLFYYYKK